MRMTAMEALARMIEQDSGRGVNAAKDILPEARLQKLEEVRKRTSTAFSAGELVEFYDDVSLPPRVVGKPCIVAKRLPNGCPEHPEREYLICVVDHENDVLGIWVANYMIKAYVAPTD